MGDEGMSEMGTAKSKEWEGVSYSDTTLPICCHLLIIDARLCFETLPLGVMCDTLLGDQLAEELAAKVARAFGRIAKRIVGFVYVHE